MTDNADDGEGMPDNNNNNNEYNEGGDTSSVRFEDLTVDDDLAILDRVVRYIRSNIALQRLVHVKMLAETAELSGTAATQKWLVPAIQPLLQDPESVIRQHVAAQLLPVALCCMLQLHQNHDNDNHHNYKVADYLENPNNAALPKTYDKTGYRMVCNVILKQYLLQHLLQDAELDVRRAAADGIAGLSLFLQQTSPKHNDIERYCLPIPLQLLNSNNNSNTKEAEELKITAMNLMAEMAGAASENNNNTTNDNSSVVVSWVPSKIVPAVLAASQDDSSSFRVRRCAAQAWPRLLGASDVETAVQVILPAFQKLAHDDIHRVRKAAAECLVDMSRAVTILAEHSCEKNASDKQLLLFAQRREILLPMAQALIQDNHKLVRQGMMQFLGPFVASFYPYQYSALTDLLPASTESDGSNHVGIVAQFFPHSTSMVSRLNSSSVNAAAAGSSPTPVHSDLEQLTPHYPKSEAQKLYQALPTFLHAARMSSWSLQAVTTHRQQHPPATADVQAVIEQLLDYFCALAAVQTGDENTNAEMRVYCAYSFPAAVLLLGPEHWEGAVRTCFHTLLNPRYGEDDDSDDDDDDDDDNSREQPPLPVKRCLASSLHTIAHILGPEITETDIIGVVQNCFLTDTDDSVRLSTIRNFAALLKCLPVSARRAPFLLWSNVVLSDEMLGTTSNNNNNNKQKARSATNPTVLNWRQRDYLARSLPELLLLIDPALTHKHIWPVLQQLLSDGVNVVREDALWAIPILLKQYCADTIFSADWSSTITEHAKKFSTEACSEVIQWIQQEILKVGGGSNSDDGNNNKNNKSTTNAAPVANFSDRQLYCRICAAVGLALRFGQGEDSTGEDGANNNNKSKDPVSALGDKFKSFFFAEKASADSAENGPYQRLTTAEQRHLKKILMDDLLPLALPMKEDRISNVRITLMKGLELMPLDVRESPNVKSVLKELQEESETWTSFGAEEPPLTQQAQQLKQQQAQQQSGPVDVDDVHVTPQGSSDELDDDDEDYEEEKEGDPSAGSNEEKQNVKVTAVAVGQHVNEDEADDDEQSDSSDSVATEVTETPPPPPPPPPKQPEKKATATDHHHHSNSSGLKKVLFEAGSIGMQLEPTADDTGCRVCGFLDADDGTPSPARASGKIEIGDVIVKVNQHHVKSYDNTIAILKAGGRRKITFRPGRPEDVQYDESGANDVDEDDSSGGDDEDLRSKQKKAAAEAAEAKAKKDAAAKRHARKEKARKDDKEKRHKKHKKEKKVRKEKKKESK